LIFAQIQTWLSSHINIWQVFGYMNVLVSTGILLLLGYNRAWDRTKWTLLVTAFVFGSGLGTMVLPSIMGALLGGLLVFLLVKKLIHFHHPTADLFTIYMIVFIGIGRLGCLFSGCCFGTETSLPWGISYGLGTLPHWLHFYTGRINELNSSSLIIHPVQLYESIFLLLGALPLVLKARSKKIEGKIILSAFIGGYFLLRFLLEFICDMSNVWWSEVFVGPISLFQLFLLAISGLSLFIAWHYSKSPWRYLKVDSPPVFTPQSTITSVVLTLLLGTVILSNQFQRIQVMLLLVLLAGLVYLSVATLLATRLQMKLRLSPQIVGAVLILALVSTNTFFASPGSEEVPLLSKSKWLYGINEHNHSLVRLGDAKLGFAEYSLKMKQLSQEETTPAEDSTLYMHAMEDFKTPRVSYYLGGSRGKYVYEVSNCGGESVTETARSSSLLAGMDKEKSRGRHGTTYLNTQFQYTQESYERTDSSEHGFDYMYTQFNTGLEREILGAGIGIGYVFSPSNQFEDIPVEIRFIPGLYLRLGPREVHLEAGINDRYYIQPGLMNLHAGLGINRRDGTRFQVGVGNRSPLVLASIGYYGSIANFPLGKRMMADFTVNFGGESAQDQGSSGFGSTILLRIPLR